MNNMDNAFHYQNLLSNLFSNGLTDSIEKLLDEINLKNEVLRIDKLWVDIGQVDEAHFEKEFVNKFLVELKKSILEAKNKPDSNTTIEKQSESFRNGLLYFMKNGILPWYIGTKNMAEFEAGMLGNWDKQDWNIIVEELRNNWNYQGQIIKRLVWQFSENFLKKILSSLLKQTIDEKVWNTLLSDLQFLYDTLDGSKNQILKEHLIQAFNLALYQNKLYTLDTLIADQLLDELRNKHDLVLKSYKGISSKIQTGFVVTILKNIHFLHENQIPFQNITAKGLLLNDESMLQQVLKKDQIQDLTFVKEPNSPPSEDSEEKASQDQEEATLFVKNCGIIILHPFLQHFFEEINLLENNNFKDEQSSQRAVLLLHYLGTGKTEAAEFDLTIPKILCNMEFDQAVPNSTEFTEEELEEATNLLKAVLQHWTSLKGTSIEGLRSTFLERAGKLSTIENGWKLTVEHKTLDILLDKLPWGISTIKLPWMKSFLNVDWI